MAQSEYSAVLKNRCSGYKFLSRVYREEVSIDYLSEFAGNGHSTPSDHEESEGNRLLREFAASLKTADLHKLQTDLAAEYAGIFRGPGPCPAYPYESVYTSKHRLLMQRARDEVVELYRQEGLKLAGEYKEPEDHVAVEFEFMAYLCRKTLETMDRGDQAATLECLEKQKAFLEEHLRVWLPRFTGDLERAAKSNLYRGMAKLTREHLDAEHETIDALIEEFKGRA
jgi:TorA maturation chaperone TorD